MCATLSTEDVHLILSKGVVQQDSKKGPFPVPRRSLIGLHLVNEKSTANNNDVAEPPVRKYDCENYETCLAVAAALDWDSFSCKDCCGQVDQRLAWRAQHARKKDSVVRALCDLPELNDAVGIKKTKPNP